MARTEVAEPPSAVLGPTSYEAGFDKRLPIEVTNDASGDHVALPSFANPRLIVPYRLGRRASYRHLEAGRSLKSAAFLLGMRYGAIRGDRVRVDGASALTNCVSEVLGRSVTLALRIGTPGAHQKVVALAFEESGRAVAFAKMASSRPAVAMVRREAEVLGRLAGFSALAGRVPNVLGLVDAPAAIVLVLSLAPKKLGHSDWRQPHDEFVERLYEVTGRVGSLRSSNLWRSALEVFDRLEGRIPELWAGRLGAALAHLEKSDSVERKLSMAHRDMTPWNTRVRTQGGLYVFDWEFAADDYPTGLDEIHFHASSAALGGNRSATSGWERLVARADRELVTSYLVDASLFYLLARYEVPDVGDETFLDWFGTQLDRALRG